MAIDVTHCECGHVFESASSSLSPLEASLRDEELYEGYLSARAEQALQVARAAEEALTEKPQNADLVSAAALAREVAKSIESDLAEQQKKLIAIRVALRDSQPAAPVIPPVAVKPATTDAANHKAAKTSKPAKAQQAKAPPAPAFTTPLKPAAQQKVRTDTVAAKPAVSAKPAADSAWRSSTSQKAAGALAAIKNAKIREAITRSQQAKTAAEAKPVAAPIPVSTQDTTVAPTAFRQEQASKAERIMEARQSVEGKECPNCTSSVPVNTTRCQCGFAFVAGGTDLPSLTLCTGDFTALRNSFIKLNLR